VNISKLSLSDVQALANEKRDDIMVRMSGVDLADHYFVVEDRRDYDTQGSSVSHFMLFLEDSPEEAELHVACSTMVEAALHYAHSFVIDNCDGADATDPVVCALHDTMQKGLRSLLK